MGAPWQDKFNYHALPVMPYVKLAMGVGGAFDFLTGKIKRAPKIMRRFGLEWLWRLLKQPARLKRIYRAVVVFPLEFLRWRFILPFFYRPNVAVMLYKKEADGYYFLIVERREEKGHWQLPQGGLDRLDLKSAGIKELREEIGCSDFRPVKTYKNLYQYKFGAREGETSYRASISRKHTGYKGVRQGLLIAEFLSNDQEIKINYWDHSAWRWVKRENLLGNVHKCRQKATAIYLKKFKELINGKHEAAI
jgi:8-oxo-dGTP pyrophosphatase MutT (NUDIX family)